MPDKFIERGYSKDGKRMEPNYVARTPNIWLQLTEPPCFN